MWTIGTKLTDFKNWYMYLIVTDVSDKTVKIWKRMQNAADLGVFYQCEEYACMLYEIDFVRICHKVWDIGTKYVTYRYQFSRALWGIGTNFSQCDIDEVWNLRFNSALSRRHLRFCYSIYNKGPNACLHQCLCTLYKISVHVSQQLK